MLWFEFVCEVVEFEFLLFFGVEEVCCVVCEVFVVGVDGSFLPLQGVSSEIVLVIGWQVSMRMMALGMLLSLRLWVYVMASSCRGIWA